MMRLNEDAKGIYSDENAFFIVFWKCFYYAYKIANHLPAT